MTRFSQIYTTKSIGTVSRSLIIILILNKIKRENQPSQNQQNLSIIFELQFSEKQGPRTRTFYVMYADKVFLYCVCNVKIKMMVHKQFTILTSRNRNFYFLDTFKHPKSFAVPTFFLQNKHISYSHQVTEYLQAYTRYSVGHIRITLLTVITLPDPLQVVQVDEKGGMVTCS